MRPLQYTEQVCYSRNRGKLDKSANLISAPIRLRHKTMAALRESAFDHFGANAKIDRRQANEDATDETLAEEE